MADHYRDALITLAGCRNLSVFLGLPETTGDHFAGSRLLDVTAGIAAARHLAVALTHLARRTSSTAKLQR